MRDAVICMPLRTPVGRYGGALKDVDAETLASLVVQAVVERSGIDPMVIEDCILGQGYPSGESPAIGRTEAGMLRERFSDALKQAMREKDALTVSTVRLILARLKERDIEVRPKGNAAGIAEPEIQQMLKGMIKQRSESIELYDKGGRPELAENERGEIAII